MRYTWRLADKLQTYSEANTRSVDSENALCGQKGTIHRVAKGYKRQAEKTKSQKIRDLEARDTMVEHHYATHPSENTRCMLALTRSTLRQIAFEVARKC
ncbi:hypothetical protein NDU88_003295 [Pleurodeles waltl]|uniref:Uncharacterized protein n=1 Tax=Pleurodeles waltl TaxID=8319 RepID=A0AAV7PCA5_PLEWA|nr:hypothetical protein NDU88_003295 [Pleurodeles waltl]